MPWNELMDVVKNIHSIQGKIQLRQMVIICVSFAVEHINPHSQKIVFVFGNNVNPDAGAFTLSPHSCADPEGEAGGLDHPF